MSSRSSFQAFTLLKTSFSSAANDKTIAKAQVMRRERGKTDTTIMSLPPENGAVVLMVLTTRINGAVVLLTACSRACQYTTDRMF